MTATIALIGWATTTICALIALHWRYEFMESQKAKRAILKLKRCVSCGEALGPHSVEVWDREKGSRTFSLTPEQWADLVHSMGKQDPDKG